MYSIESTFGLRFISLLAIVLLLGVSFNIIMRKWLKVERKKLFSYNHVNEKHKKIDWTMRMITIASILLGFIINMSRASTDWFWFLQSWVVLFIFIVVSETVRAVMEKKYAKNLNAYKLTISELLFVLILFFILFKTDFFGLL
ncbi:DUF4181 domain-containing protein [Priestia filamentosa]|uniref:Uncharacterized protein n=1 Tax=Priestia filamentosa TaxID=1402861 RepID=A0A1X7DJI3_9BACI|nr:DUF4181 domain-containing protein [Priestia filamentosa]AKO93370.1 hypothetical protein BEH_15605 [Priestia filamentosa]MDT3763535.1 DUF4181 domain-containing protein [Priestia filamentosa]OXS71968.1 hypothetical protein B1B01_06515 [Priestia filamentosa]WRU93972.1 DUF4181 domain-containing protein [Priestia filamentosa]SMF16624.1 protein of unknown function [Priestia filamentosa]